MNNAFVLSFILVALSPALAAVQPAGSDVVISDALTSILSVGKFLVATSVDKSGLSEISLLTVPDFDSVSSFKLNANEPVIISYNDHIILVASVLFTLNPFYNETMDSSIIYEILIDAEAGSLTLNRTLILPDRDSENGTISYLLQWKPELTPDGDLGLIAVPSGSTHNYWGVFNYNSWSYTLGPSISSFLPPHHSTAPNDFMQLSNSEVVFAFAQDIVYPNKQVYDIVGTSSLNRNSDEVAYLLTIYNVMSFNFAQSKILSSSKLPPINASLEFVPVSVETSASLFVYSSGAFEDETSSWLSQFPYSDTFVFGEAENTKLPFAGSTLMDANIDSHLLFFATGNQNGTTTIRTYSYTE